MTTETRKGIITQLDNYEAGDGIYVDGEVLSDSLSDLSGMNVTVRMYVSESEKEITELKENLILTISGALYADYGDAYSEYTGYLWTDDNLNIGNHNLLSDIECHVGKYIYLEIDIH